MSDEMEDQIGRYAEALGSAIKAARKSRGLSASEVARKARVSYTTLHHIERGRPPDMKTLLALTNAIGVPMSEIVTTVEGSAQQVTQPPAQSAAATNDEPWENGDDHSVSATQRRFLDHLSWAFLRAARSTNRGTTRAILEELVVACGLAINEAAGETAKKNIVKQRAG